MTTSVGGRPLTRAERRVACTIQDYLKAHGGDSWAGSPNVSPKGDGRWVPLLDIFPRSAQGTADRRTALRLHAAGVLKAFEVALKGGRVKAVPLERVPAEEATPVPVKFWSRLFCPAGSPTPCYQLKADAMRNKVSGEEWVECEWARWADLAHPVRHTFRSPAVFAQAVDFKSRGENWRDLFAAILAELPAADPFAGRLEEIIRFAGAAG